MMQPGVDDLPFVTAARAEIQQRGASVLKLAKEFQRIAGGRRCRIDWLGLEPTIPFLKHLRLPLILSHRTRVPMTQRDKTLEKGPSGGRAGLWKQVFGETTQME